MAVGAKYYFASSRALSGAGSATPREWILVAALGDNPSSSGAFKLTREGAAKIISAFKENGVKIPVDYEHQTVGGRFSSPDGKAPAAGWIDDLQVYSAEEAPYDGIEGLWAHVDWTTEAFDLIVARKYAYLSPVLDVDVKTSEAVELHSMALTNIPAMRNAPKVAAKKEAHAATGNPQGPVAPGSSSGGDNPGGSVVKEMMEKLRLAVGLQDGASDEEIIGAALERLSVKEEENKTEVETLKKSLGDLAEKLSRTEFDAMIDGAVRDGKMTPGELRTSREALYRFFKSSPNECRTLIAGRVPVAAGAATEPVPEPAQKRAMVIHKASAEWGSERSLHLLCDRDAYVDDQLREAGLSSLTDDERKGLPLN